MAIANRSSGTVGIGSTSVTAGMPAGASTGDIVLLFVMTKPDTAVINTPADWTLVADVAGGGGTSGNGTGPTRQAVFSREKDASWSTMPAVSITNGNASAAFALAYSKAAGVNWGVAASTATWGTAAATTNGSVVHGSNPGIQAGDFVVVGYSNQDEAPTWSGQATTAPGITAWGAVTERSEAIETTTGNDMGGMVYDQAVTTGTATGAPTTAATLSAAGRGTAALVRLREVVAGQSLTESQTDQMGLTDSANVVLMKSLSEAATESLGLSDTFDVTLTPSAGPKYAKVQAAHAGGNPNSAVTLPQAPTQGNILVAMVYDRSGGSTGTIDGTGWTKVVEHPQNIANTTFRKFMAVWYKIADAGEPTTITMTTNANTSTAGAVVEISKPANATYRDLVVTGHDTDSQSFSTGTTPNVNAANVGLVGVAALKPTETADTPVGATWSNGFTQIVERDESATGRDLAMALGESATGGTFSSTITGPTGASWNAGAIMALLVFGEAQTGTALTESQTDQLGLTDTSAFVQGHGQRTTDTLGLTDAAAVAQGHVRTHTDQENLTDSVRVSQGHAHAATDSLGLTDSATVNLGRAVAAEEQMGLTDQATVVLLRTMSETATDTVGISDTSVLAMEHVGRMTDVLNLTDTATVAQTSTIRPTDQVGLTDAALLRQGHARTVTDQLGLSDAIATVMSHVLRHTDQFGLTDTVNVSMSSSAGVDATDAMGLTDTVTILMYGLISQAVLDTLGISDQAVLRQEHAVRPTDMMTFDDRAVLRQDHGLQALEDLVISDLATVGLDTPLFTDDLMGLDDSYLIEMRGPFVWVPGAERADASFAMSAGVAGIISGGQAEFLGGAGDATLDPTDDIGGWA